MNLSQEQSDRLEVIESAYQKMLMVLNHNTKTSREKTVALEKLEEMELWAVKSIYEEVQ